MFVAPELSWYVYGSFIYFSEEMKDCNHQTQNPLASLYLLLILYTLAVFLVITLSIIMFVIAYLIFRKSTRSVQKATRGSNFLLKFLSNIPLLCCLDTFVFYRFQTKFEKQKQLVPKKSSLKSRDSNAATQKLQKKKSTKMHGRSIFDFMQAPQLPLVEFNQIAINLQTASCQLCDQSIELHDKMV